MRCAITFALFLSVLSGFCQNAELDSLLQQIDENTGEEILQKAKNFLHDKTDTANWLKESFYFYDNQNRYAQAFPFGEDAAMLFQKMSDTANWLEVNHALMVGSVRIGSFEEGLSRAQKAYDMSEAIKDSAELIHYLADLGWIYHDYKQYEKGIGYGKRSLELAFDFSQSTPRNFYDPYMIIAINFDDWNKPDSALHYHFLNLANTKKLEGEDTLRLSQLYNNIGNTYRKKSDYKQSLTYLRKALVIELFRNDIYSLATVYNNLGDVSYKMGNHALASEYLSQAINYSRKSNSVEKLLDTYETYYKFYEHTGNLDKAIEYQDKFHQLSDSLFREETSQKIALMEVRFDTEKKEQQIVIQEAQLEEQQAVLQRNRVIIVASIVGFILLTAISLLWRNRVKKHQQIKLQKERLKTQEAEMNATISSQEKERTRYARDLHDGFGQMISVLNLNLKGLDGANPSEQKKISDRSSEVLEGMYDELKNICFDLMPQTLVKNGLQSGLVEFVERINKTGKVQITFNSFGLESRLEEVQEIALFRISQEWTNNILKHSDASNITIQITKDENEITLLIEDDGSGFDKSLLTTGSGNGWKNLNTRAVLIQGVLELETSVGLKGSSLIVNAPARMVASYQQQDIHQKA